MTSAEPGRSIYRPSLGMADRILCLSPPANTFPRSVIFEILGRVDPLPHSCPAQVGTLRRLASELAAHVLSLEKELTTIRRTQETTKAEVTQQTGELELSPLSDNHWRRKWHGWPLFSSPQDTGLGPTFSQQSKIPSRLHCSEDLACPALLVTTSTLARPTPRSCRPPPRGAAPLRRRGPQPPQGRRLLQR